ncbi:Ig-like domain repeat protein [Dietzia sp. NPDC055343]
MSRTPSSALSARPSPDWQVRAAIALTAAVVLVLGVLPSLGAGTANAGTATLGNFRTTITVNQSQSDLRPGGHVRYDITAANTQARDTVSRPVSWLPEVKTPNYTALLFYGIDAPAGLTYRASGGQIYSPGNWEQGGNFTGGLSANLSNITEVSDLVRNVADLGPAFVRGQDSRSGWISFNIPHDARGGTSYRAGARLMESRIFPSPSAPATRSTAGIESFTLGAVNSHTRVSIPPAVARVGEPVDLSATVSAAAGSNTPAGTMTFAAVGQSQTAPVVNGVATTSMTFATAGNKPVTATFTPSNTTQWRASTATGTVRVEAEATQTNLELDAVEIISGDTISATANVTPADAEGAVEFTVGDQSQTVPVAAGSAIAEFTLDIPENAAVTATFIPANPERYTSSTDTETVTVSSERTATSVAVTPEISRVGEDSTLRATVTPAAASGTVTFTVEGNEYTVDVIDGEATAVHQFNATGEVPVTAEFTPADANRYASSTGQAIATVQVEATETDLELDAVKIISGDTLSVTARVAPADAVGDVEFVVDGQTQTIPLVGGVATAEFTLDAPTDATLTATFVPTNPDRYTTSSDTESVSVTAETTKLSIAVGDAVVLDEPTALTASVAPAGAEGTVTFTIDGHEYVVDVVDGVAVVEHTFTEYGEYPAAAVFTPKDANRYSSSEVETTIVIDPVTGSLDLGSLGSMGGSSDWMATLNLGSLNALVGSTGQFTR